MKELISKLSLAFGPSGCEDIVRDMARAEAEKYADESICDRLGNLICKMSFGSGGKRIMLSAHLDEVGFMIDGIDEGGFLTFGSLGGIDGAVCPGRAVKVGNEKGQVSGIICSKAIHHKGKEERDKLPDCEKLFIDIGEVSKEGACSKVSIGDFATFDSDFLSFGKDGDTVKCKALDDRMSCASMLTLMKELSESRKEIPPCEVYFCFTVREEIGYSGAGAAAERIRPQLALVLETTAISDLPSTPPHRRVAEVGSGVVVSFADRATVYPEEFVESALALAKEKGIKAQIKKYISGGNDAGRIHKSAGGIKTLALSVPTRYLHSPSCVASLGDCESQKELAKAIILNFERF